MKFTEKLKAKKADKIENPAKETAKKEKKPLKQKIKDSMNKKYIKNGSYSVVISAVFIVISSCSQYDRWFPSIQIYRSGCQCSETLQYH